MSTVVQDLQRATGGINDIETALIETGAIQSGDTCPIEDMDDAIRSLEKTLAPKSITSNGTYNPAEDNLDGYSEVIVEVSSTEPVLGTKTITENGEYNASSDDVDGYSSVTVEVPSTEPSLGIKVITENGEYNASSDFLDGYRSVTVDVPSTEPVLGTKTITENGEYNASSDSLDGYSNVTVNVPKGKLIIYLTKDTTAIKLLYVMGQVAIDLSFSGEPSENAQVISIERGDSAPYDTGLDLLGLHNSDYRTAKENDKISFTYNSQYGLFSSWQNFFTDYVQDEYGQVDKLKFSAEATANMFMGTTFKDNSVDLRWLELDEQANATSMFEYCSELQSIIGFDMSNLSTVAYMFDGCSALQHLTAFPGTTLCGSNTGVNIDLSASAVFDIMEFINSLETSPIALEADYATITVHADVFATLTAEDLATIADKHYKVVSA